MGEDRCAGCESRDRLLDELVWAIDHLADPRQDMKLESDAIIGRARDHVAGWHRDRALGRVIDLREEPAHGERRCR